MRKPRLPILIQAALGIVFILLGGCQPPGRDIYIPQGRIEFSATQASISGEFAARISSMLLVNTTDQPLHPIIIHVPDGASPDEMVKNLKEDLSSGSPDLEIIGAVYLPAGQNRLLTFNFNPGTYMVADFSRDADQSVSFTVPRDNPSKGAPPVGFVNLDYSITSINLSPEELASGAYTWEMTASGAGSPEFQVLKLAENRSREDVEQFLNGTWLQATAPFTLVEAWGPVSPGQKAWIKLNLEPGQYVAAVHQKDKPETFTLLDFSVK